MRLILICLLLNLTACSLIETSKDSGEEETDTSLSAIPIINLITKMLPETYRLEIQQGNHVTSDMMMKLKPDMTKYQVKFILGTSLIKDSFHNNRWDYIFVMRKEGKLVESRHVTLFFKNELLSEIKGDIIELKDDAYSKGDVTNTNFDSEQVLGEGSTNNSSVKDKLTFGGSETGSIKIIKEIEGLKLKSKELNPVISSVDSAGKAVKNDIADSLPDESQPGYFELLIESIGF